jgi:hypothetical protein
MARLRIALDPSKLANPDLDLRYVLPDALCAIPDCGLQDDGFDYSDDSPPLLLIYLTSDAPDKDAELAVRFLRSNAVLENNLLDAATVCVTNNDTDWRQVFPTA